MLFLAVINTLALAFAAAVVFGVAYGSGQATYFALAMKYTRPAIAASMYSILMSVTNIGQGIGMGIGGVLVENLGYTWTFLLFAGVLVLALPLFPILFRHSQPLTTGEQAT
jgi:PAT family beta-lactamase induction signal transducer AmpG